MLKVITADIAFTLKYKSADFKFPENGLSPYEQINWLNELVSKHDFYKEDISIITFSPYILNYLNILIVKNLLNESNFSVMYFYSDDNEMEEYENSLLAKDENGNLIVDTFDFSEPFMEMHKTYNMLISKHNEKQ